MPQTMNGIGTWYYGKKDVSSLYGVCEFCKKDGDLLSYDTTLYFVFIFVPLFPLKNMRVMFECPHCKMHRAQKLKEWQEAKQEAFKNASKDIKETDDIEKIKEAISVYVGYQDADAFEPQGKYLRDKFKDNTDILNRLGGAYAAFNLYAKAEEVFKQILSLKDSHDIRERLADVLVKQDKLEDARKYLQHVIDEEIPDRIGDLMFLARAYQTRGDHMKALELFDSCLQIMPMLDKDKFYTKTRKLSEKNLKTGKPIKNDILPIIPKKEKRTDLTAIIPKLIGPMILITILTVYLWLCYSNGQNREIYFVNGLDRHYSVKINGQNTKLGPCCHRIITLPEGKISLESEDLKIPLQTFDIQTSFFIRPFLSRTFVINPDSVAVLLWQKIYYSAKASDANKAQFIFYTGKILQIFKGVDYSFCEFPKSLRVKENSSLAKTRISLFSKYLLENNALGNWQNLATELGKNKTEQLAVKMLKLIPNNENPLFYLYDSAKSKRFTELIKPLLSERPVQVNIHRMYQEAMKKLGKRKSLEDEYRNILTKEKDNNALKYLLSRIAFSTKENQRLAQESVKGESPCPYGYYSLGYMAMVTGNFNAASGFLQKALAMEPKNTTFQKFYLDSLVATGKFDLALDLLRKKPKKQILDFSGVPVEMEILILQNKKKAATQFLNKKIKCLETKLPPEQRAYYRNFLNAVYKYLNGDSKEFSKFYQKEKNPYSRFAAAISENQAEKAEEILAKIKKPENHCLLILYLALIDNGLKSRAEKIKLKTIIKLQQGDEDDILMAAYLSGEKKPDLNKIKEAGINLETKIPLLLTLGKHYPELKEKCFNQAEKFIYGKLYPYLFYKRVMDNK